MVTEDGTLLRPKGAQHILRPVEGPHSSDTSEGEDPDGGNGDGEPPGSEPAPPTPDNELNTANDMPTAARDAPHTREEVPTGTGGVMTRSAHRDQKALTGFDDLTIDIEPIDFDDEPRVDIEELQLEDQRRVVDNCRPGS